MAQPFKSSCFLNIAIHVHLYIVLKEDMGLPPEKLVYFYHKPHPRLLTLLLFDYL